MKGLSISQPLILALALNNYDPFFGVETKEDSRDMDDDIYLRVLNYIRTANQRSVLVLAGGEPFLDPRIKEILTVAKNCGWSTSTDTWCGFREDPSLDMIHQMRLRLLSLNPKMHDELLGEEGNHQRILAFAKRLSEDFSGERILVFPISRENRSELSGILSWCREYRFRPNMFTVPRQHKRALLPEEYPEVIRELCALPLQDVIIDTPLLGLHGWPNLCSGGRLAMFIDVDGGVKPCPYFPYSLCHLDEEGVVKAWRSLQGAVANLNARCSSSCSQFAVCGGGCLVNKTDSGREYYCPYE
jgi:radical SAM protein with 4Fe4S-binding SPASM domain